MSTVAELTGQLKEVLAQIRRADPYESVRLSEQAMHLTTQIRYEKALAQQEHRGVQAKESEAVQGEAKTLDVDMVARWAKRRTEERRASEEQRP